MNDVLQLGFKNLFGSDPDCECKAIDNPKLMYPGRRAPVKNHGDCKGQFSFGRGRDKNVVYQAGEKRWEKVKECKAKDIPKFVNSSTRRAPAKDYKQCKGKFSLGKGKDKNVVYKAGEKGWEKVKSESKSFTNEMDKMFDNATSFNGATSLPQKFKPKRSIKLFDVIRDHLDSDCKTLEEDCKTLEDIDDNLVVIETEQFEFEDLDIFDNHVRNKKDQRSKYFDLNFTLEEFKE